MAMRRKSSIFGDAAMSTPVTLTIVILLVASSLLQMGHIAPMFEYFGFFGSAIPRIWTLLTYPFTGSLGVVGLVLIPAWLMGTGGDMERDHGFKGTILLWIIIALVSVAPFVILSLPVATSALPIAAQTVIWGTRHPNNTVMMMGFIPMKAKWVAWLAVVSNFLAFATFGVVPAIAGSISCGIAFLYATNRIPRLPYALKGGSVAGPAPKKVQTRIAIKNEEEFYDEVYRRETEREERERLRKLFESSLEDDKK